MHITWEATGDAEAIDRVHSAAFGGAYEADLVRALRADGLVAASLVAMDNDEVIGHVLLSDLGVEVDGRAVKAVALAPVAVRPDRQGQGIGSRLIREGLEAVRQKGYEAAIVLGHPGYYPRFGFSAALARKLSAPFRGEAFMAAELVAGSLAGKSGSVRYPSAFGIA